MVNEKKIEEIRKKIKDAIKKDKMFIENEPEYSGDPKEAIKKDPEEKEAKNEKRDSDKK